MVNRNQYKKATMFKNILFILCFTMSSLAFSMEMNSSTNIKEVSETNYYLGGVLGVLPGFGIGHAVQGRWKDKGWIFTAGELTTAIGLIYFTMQAIDALPSIESIEKKYTGDSNSSSA